MMSVRKNILRHFEFSIPLFSFGYKISNGLKSSVDKLIQVRSGVIINGTAKQ